MKRFSPTLPTAAAAAFFLALITVLALPAEAHALPCPIVVGHRAGANLAPENTVAGIRAVADINKKEGVYVGPRVPMVEMDVRYTASGYPYLLHDETLDRTTDATGPIASKWVSDMGPISAADYAPWKAMLAPDGTPLYWGKLANGKARTEVPYVSAWLQAVKDGNVDGLLDAKVTPTKAQADILMSYVNRSDLNLASRLIYMGDPANVTAMRGWYPQLRYAVIEYPPAGRVFTPEYLASVGAGIYAVPYDRITPGLVTYMHAAGIKVYTWTSDSAAKDIAANWQAVRAAGVDALITNEPAAALAAFAPACNPPTPTPSASESEG